MWRPKTRRTSKAEHRLRTSSPLFIEPLECRALLAITFNPIINSTAQVYKEGTHQILAEDASASTAATGFQQDGGSFSARADGLLSLGGSSLTISASTHSEFSGAFVPNIGAEGRVAVTGSFTLTTPETLTLVHESSRDPGTESWVDIYNSDHISIAFEATNGDGVTRTYTTIFSPGIYYLDVEIYSHSVTQASSSFFPSDSGDLFFSIVATSQRTDTTTALSGGTPNPSGYGQPVTFTATVSPAVSGQPIPTGTVTFMEGANPLGPAIALDGTGNATFTTSNLPVGAHAITAVYGGDGNFNGSISLSVTQTVNDDPFRVSQGQLTFDAEGDDNPNSVYFSRRIHWPGGSSGVTIGRGYDMGGRSGPEIIADLEQAGVPASQATRIAGAQGKTGQSARNFVLQNQSSIGAITPDQQKHLFELTYSKYIVKAETAYSQYTTDSNGSPLPGRIAWDDLDQPIRDVLVDLVYNGYAGQTAMPAAMTNDPDSFIAYLETNAELNKPGGVHNRTQKRIDYLYDYYQ